MNLTPEELQFFRAQRLAASTEAIAFNHALCGQLLAVIPATQQPGPSFPVPLATMTHMELNDWKNLLVQFFDGKNCYAQMLPILANWKPDIMAVAPAPPALSDNRKADALLMALTNEHHFTSALQTDRWGKAFFFNKKGFRDFSPVSRRLVR